MLGLTHVPLSTPDALHLREVPVLSPPALAVLAAGALQRAGDALLRAGTGAPVLIDSWACLSRHLPAAVNEGFTASRFDVQAALLHIAAHGTVCGPIAGATRRLGVLLACSPERLLGVMVPAMLRALAGESRPLFAHHLRLLARALALEEAVDPISRVIDEVEELLAAIGLPVQLSACGLKQDAVHDAIANMHPADPLRALLRSLW